MLTYSEALEFIHGLNRFGTKLGLENITNLLDILDNPHHGIKVIHVAGTNGKGSTCAMIDSILRAAGYKVGLYTSPYLEVFNERIRVNGKNIPDEDLARLTQKVRDAISAMQKKNLGYPTEFEVVTALGFLYFKEQAVDFIVLEVGMGGRLDATNVVTPLVSVITPISFDHQKYLGNTLADISREKCGIIKERVPVVSGPQDAEAMRVIEEACARQKCTLKRVLNSCEDRKDIDYICYKPIYDGVNDQVFDLDTLKNHYSNLRIRLTGSHQLENAAAAVGAIEALELSGIKITKDAIYTGLENARWPGRLEILKENPTVLIDGAHNVAGVRTLKEAILKHFSKKKKILVLGILEDKDYKDMIREIVPLADTIITTAPDNPRAISAERLAEVIKESCPENEKRHDNIYAVKKIKDAVSLSLELAAPGDLIVFAGSLYMIGSVRTIFSNLR
ncbi:MAG TPA: bifunctional folylpolyglutamate synthase/dihydrofolate synthase [Thermoanaerobacterales bacterium]|nr:bifunctional folylpolyglutamate synthase/dihydrofolate synthase [Thermoanaerobacterales bacterium]